MFIDFSYIVITGFFLDVEYESKVLQETDIVYDEVQCNQHQFHREENQRRKTNDSIRSFELAIHCVCRPKAPPDSSAIRRMQNRWEAETQQRGADAAKSQVPKTTPAGRSRDRWATSSESQTPPNELSRSNQQQARKTH